MAHFVFSDLKQNVSSPDTKGFALIDAAKLDKVGSSAKIKNAFKVRKANGDVAEWLKAAVC